MGQHFGGAPGAVVGAKAGSVMSRLLGFGEYSTSNQVKVNSITNAPNTNALPLFDVSGHGVRIRHKETLGIVSGSTGFSSSVYPINPAQSKTFPWLSQVARLFDEYEVHGLVFAFSSTQGSIAAASPALGTVLMATQYDAYEPQFTSLVNMLSYEFSTNGVPTHNLLHGVECDPGQRNRARYYTRPFNDVQGSLLDYDVGKFTFATQGMQSPYAIGLLSVIYDVTLRKPRISLDAGLSQCFQYQIQTGDASIEYDNLVCPTFKTGLVIQTNTITGTLGVPAGDGKDLPYYWDGLGGDNTSPDGKMFGIGVGYLVLPNPGKYKVTMALYAGLPGVSPPASFNSNFVYDSNAVDPTQRFIRITPACGDNISYDDDDFSPAGVRLGSSTGVSIQSLYNAFVFTVKNAGIGVNNRINFLIPSTGRLADGTTVVPQVSRFRSDITIISVPNWSPA